MQISKKEGRFNPNSPVDTFALTRDYESQTF